MNSYLQKAQLATIGFGSQWQLQGWIQLATDPPETQNDPPSFRLHRKKSKGLRKVPIATCFTVHLTEQNDQR